MKNKKIVAPRRPRPIEGDLVEFNFMVPIEDIVECEGWLGMEDLIHQQNPYNGFKLIVLHYIVVGFSRGTFGSDKGEIMLRVQARLK